MTGNAFEQNGQKIQSYLPKSAELAKAILTTINSAIKKEPIKGSLFMAGTTSGFADGRHEVSPDSEETKRLNREV